MFRSLLACCLVGEISDPWIYPYICGELVVVHSLVRSDFDTVVPKELGLQCSVEYIFIMQKTLKNMEEYLPMYKLDRH